MINKSNTTKFSISSSTQVLNKENKNIITFFQTKRLKDFHNAIFEDIFEKNADFERLKINVYLLNENCEKMKYCFFPVIHLKTS